MQACMNAGTHVLVGDRSLHSRSGSDTRRSETRSLPQSGTEEECALVWPPRQSSCVLQATSAWPAQGGSPPGNGGGSTAPSCGGGCGVGGADLTPLTARQVSVASSSAHTSHR